MNAQRLLEGMVARGFAVSLEGEHLAVSPKSRLTPKIRDALKAHKPELVSLLQCGNAFALGAFALGGADAPAERVGSIEEARERLNRLEAAKGTAGACRSIWRASRRLERGPNTKALWRQMNASDRRVLAVCGALLDCGLDPDETLNEGETKR